MQCGKKAEQNSRRKSQNRGEHDQPRIDGKLHGRLRFGRHKRRDKIERPFRDDNADDSAKRGYELFIDKAGCAQCHSIRQSYALFTDGDFHNTGAFAEV